MTTPRRAVRPLAYGALVLAALVASAPRFVAAQRAEPAILAPTPAVLVTTRRLDNGLLVWHQYIPGDETVRVVLVVAGGSSLDPRGKEELAHFVEHVAFGDRPGLTELELNRQVESRGGRIRGHTDAEQTRFEVTLPAREGGHAIRWLAQLVAPRAVTAALVAQQRRPIALERGLTARRPLDWVRALVLDPPVLRRPSAWQRDFGLTSAADGDASTQRALEAITADDVGDFMRSHYVPSRMALVVTGGLELAASVSAAEGGLGRLAAPVTRALPSAPILAVQRHDRAWTLRRTASYALSLRARGMSGADRMRWLVLRDLLDQRLNDRLRYGARKLVYHPSVSAAVHADAAVMTVYAESSPHEVDAVRAIIDEEVAQLRAGTLPESAFVAARAAIAGRARVAMQGRDPLADLFMASFRGDGDAEPLANPLAVYDTTSRAALAAFLARRAPEAGEGSRLVRPFGVPPGAILALAALEVLLVVHLLKRLLVRPLEMRRVRYVAGLRFDPAILFLAFIAFGLPLVVGLRIALALARPAIEAFVVPLPSAALQLLAYLVILALVVAAVIVVGSRIPWTVLVFDDHVRLKYLSYRSRIIPFGDLAEVSLEARALAWWRRSSRGCVPLALLGRPLLLIRTRAGDGYLLRVRDTPELAAVLRQLVDHESAMGATRSGDTQ